jgi:hypothetical protein
VQWQHQIGTKILNSQLPAADSSLNLLRSQSSQHNFGSVRENFAVGKGCRILGAVGGFGFCVHSHSQSTELLPLGLLKRSEY